MEPKTPKVTLLSWTSSPLELVYVLWQASKNEEQLLTVEDVKRTVPDADVRKLFQSVIAQKIPIGEHIDFVFMIENVSVSWREQAVRHRIGTTPSPERVGVDIVMGEIPNLADSSWWSQCFTGDTRICLLDGTTSTLAELAERGGQFWVYSCDAQGRVVPGRGHSARKTGHLSIVEVELDNGERIRCTPEHLWLGRDGKYIEARDLVPGTSLMPLHTRFDKYGYEQHLVPATGRYAYTHQIVDQALNGSLPEGHVVHHASFDKLNNDPECLERMAKQNHIDLHAALIVERMESNPEGHAAALSTAQKRRWEAMSESERIAARARLAKARANIDPERLAEAARKLMDGRWSDEEWRDKMAPVLADNGSKTKGRKQSVEERQRRSAIAKNRFIHQKAEGAVPPGFNHKVVAVRELNKSADVYDITVDEHHNFALASGVFVHNSMRIQDMSTFAQRGNYRVPQTLLDHPDERLLKEYHAMMGAIQDAYAGLVAAGIPMEDARELIPLGAQHRISWRLNIGALQHIVGKRGCWILQLGIWGPVIEGMVRELAEKVDPIFSELVTPPCIKEDEFAGCVYHEENRRRYTGDDKLPVCPLHLTHHGCPSEGFPASPQPGQEYPPRTQEMVARAEDYRKFWGRDPYTGKRLRVIQ